MSILFLVPVICIVALGIISYQQASEEMNGWADKLQKAIAQFTVEEKDK